MSLSRRTWASGPDSTGPEGGARTVRFEQRRATRTGVVGEGTLACPRCDAPISIGSGGLVVSARLTCPYCAHQAPVRDYLSLSRPTRPARVVIRVRVPARPGP